MKQLVPKTFYELTDCEVAELTQNHYGKEYFPDSDEIGGDESGGYQLVPATLADTEKYSYWVNQAEEYFTDSTGAKHVRLNSVIHKLVKDGHIPYGNYLIEGIWG